MSKIISSKTCESAYIKVCKHLLSREKNDEENLIVEIISPCDFSKLNYCFIKLNPVKIDSNTDDLRHVINTIFPFRLANHFNDNRQGLYSKYLKLYKKGTNRKWGTYFQRIINFSKHGINGINQLENIIQSLNSSVPHKYYNLMHLTSVNLESNVRPFGGPCLQYIQINKKNNRTLNLVAIYRNHDYFSKGLGNFFGLAFLLNFIATNTGYSIGKLTIHSIHAFSSKGKVKLKTLIKDMI